MSENCATSGIFQLRVVIRGISPLIWRRLLVPSGTTIADLHGILQVVLGWEDEHLHLFRIHGKDYGIGRAGGIGFADDPRAVRLADFRLHRHERFLYVYNFNVNWECEIRLEAALLPDPRYRYPVCRSGRRADPPEDCQGPWAYLEALNRRRFPLESMQVMAKAIQALRRADRNLSMQEALGKKRYAEFRAAAEQVRAYYQPELFDRRVVNKRLFARAWEGAAAKVVSLG